ncbi:lysozyme inhibitor LprI family protein [Rhodoligotrophos defluvii]|uniref:lysozyme inhibitor LprI family protein n=1 Tax=Rhodoligotrophos defluvii TaxID=2561934 RepID=UPI0010C9BCCE|nr:hypothetical protein [Rhodoligotrophos defluvii]
MLKPFILSATAVIIAGLALSAPAEAASFDCRAAQTPDEIAVCSNHRLSALDSEMGALWFTYSRLPLAMGAAGARQDDARAFLQQRMACGADVGCLTAIYKARIRALRQGVDQGLKAMTNAMGGGPI